LTLADLVLGTRLYYPGLDPLTYQGGYLEYVDLLTGILGRWVVYVFMIGLNSLLIVPLAYLAFFDRALSTNSRRLARLLLVTQVLVVAINMTANNILPPGIASLIGSMFFILAYAYAAFQQMISERQYQIGRLRTRLTALTMAVSLPLFVLISNSLIYQARDQLEDMAFRRLEERSTSVAASTELWLENNIGILQNMAVLPGIVSMDVEQQRPILQAVAASYPYMYLVSTTDTSGMNVARNDEEAPKDYSDRVWYQNAVAGAEVTFQLLIGRTSHRPALVVSTPVRDESGQIIGVAMFASELTAISDIVATAKIGETGYSYLVNEADMLLAHPDIDALMLAAGGDEPKIVSFAEDTAVMALRSGRAAPLRYSDEQGVQWVAFYTDLGSGWGLVVQQQAEEILVSAQSLQRTAWGIIVGGGMILFLVVWATMRQAFQPVTTLTEAVEAITEGNLERVAAVESGDEIGILAQAFNVMTTQLRELISSLERRVAERTGELERRAVQLQAAAEVGSAVTSVRDLNQLLQQVTQLISERFNYYHVGIFLLDEKGENAVLRASNSPGGQRMLARGHQLAVGQKSIVGYVTEKREPRIAMDVGQDAVYFDNPDLPETRSEMALPLITGGELLGALDVQSVEEAAFTQEDIATLQVLAGQVAVAIENANLFAETQAALETARQAYGQVSREAWLKILRSRPDIGYICDNRGRTEPAKSGLTEEMVRTRNAGRVMQPDPQSILVPFKIHDQPIGMIRMQKPVGTSEWTKKEIDLVEALAGNLSDALEAARLYSDSQGRAERERILAEITAKVRATTDINVIMETAVQELARALRISRGVIQLRQADATGDTRGDSDE
jgi:GAF domain-containing protein/HAMP domain-containing protein